MKNSWNLTAQSRSYKRDSFKISNNNHPWKLKRVSHAVRKAVKVNDTHPCSVNRAFVVAFLEVSAEKIRCVFDDNSKIIFVKSS